MQLIVIIRKYFVRRCYHGLVTDICRAEEKLIVMFLKIEFEIRQEADREARSPQPITSLLLKFAMRGQVRQLSMA